MLYLKNPVWVEIEPGTSGLKELSCVKCEDLRALSPVRVEQRFGHADEAVVFRVETMLRRLLAL